MTISTKRALLVMDVQNATVEMLGDESERYLARLREAVAGARGAAIQVIYVRIAFRKGAPEVSERNQVFQRMRSDVFEESSIATRIHEAVAPLADDIIVTK